MQEMSQKLSIVKGLVKYLFNGIPFTLEAKSKGIEIPHLLFLPSSILVLDLYTHFFHPYTTFILFSYTALPSLALSLRSIRHYISLHSLFVIFH